MSEFRLITVDPGHFHASLIQKEMYPGVSPRASVYAPLGADLAEHLRRVARFNARALNPTRWELDVHAAPDFVERMAAERPGGIVLLSGRNQDKIRLVRAALDAGLHVLADKPWIIRAADLPALEDVLALARRKELIAYDIMTERYEITSILQRELVNDPEVFGSILSGTEAEPAVYMESVHHILKLVAGAPNLRPPWFFDIEEQGEALADVGTHLVDLVQWTLFPESSLDCRSDIRMLAAKRWPLAITETQMRQVTGEPSSGLDYYCNTSVSYAVRGIHAKLDVLWRWAAPEGAGDTHFAVYRGTNARVEVRQATEEGCRPELYVVAETPTAVRAVAARIDALAARYPGLSMEEHGAEVRIVIPEEYRVGHEAHFAQVTNQFFSYLRHPEQVPAWEEPGMLAKYFVTTEGVQLSHRP